MKNFIKYQLIYTIMIIALIVIIIININTGNTKIDPIKLFKIIFLNDSSDVMAYNVIWKIRLPRILTAAILGGALSVSGYLLQTFFRNPIAGPYILGISSGAKMFMAVIMVFVLKDITSINSWNQIFFAFIGSILSMFYVLIFANKVRSMSMLLVIGVMISYICSAITDFCVTFAQDEDIANLTHWAMGSFSASSWKMAALSFYVVIPAVICTLLLSKPIAAYQLGEGYAKSMGVNIKFFRIAVIVLSSILSACVTALAGPISFVGIAVPQMTKLIFRTSKPQILIVGIFITGSVFCILCDLIARTIFAPTELAISTVTALFGAPVVIWLMIKKKNRI